MAAIGAKMVTVIPKGILDSKILPEIPQGPEEL